MYTVFFVEKKPPLYYHNKSWVKKGFRFDVTMGVYTEAEI